jgi:hypothetical protein
MSDTVRNSPSGRLKNFPDGQFTQFETVDEVRNAPEIAEGTIFFIEGVDTPEDEGGGGWLSLRGAPGTYTDNTGTVLQPNGGDGSVGYVRRPVDGVRPEFFGARNDGSTLSTSSVDASVASSLSTEWSGTYKLTIANVNKSDVDGNRARLIPAANNNVILTRTQDFATTETRDMRNLRFDGNGLTGITGYRSPGILRDFARNLSFINIDKPLEIKGGIYCRYENVNVRNGFSLGLRLTDESAASVLNRFENFNAQTGGVGAYISAPNGGFVHNQVFEGGSFQSTDCGVIIDGSNGTLSDVRFSGTHFEANGLVPGNYPVTIDTTTVPAPCDAYISAASASFTNGAFASNSPAAVRAENGAYVAFDSVGGPSTGGQSVILCDDTSHSDWRGEISLLGSNNRGCDYSQASPVFAGQLWSAWRQPPALVRSQAIRNVYKNSVLLDPYLPTLADPVLSTPGSAIDSELGPVSSVLFAASVGSASSNRVRIYMFPSGAAVVGRIYGVSLLMRSTSGSPIITISSPWGGANITATVTLSTEWQRVTLTCKAVSTNADRTLYIYAADSSGSTVYISGVTTMDEDHARKLKPLLQGQCSERDQNIPTTAYTSSQNMTAAHFGGSLITMNNTTLAYTAQDDAAVPAPIGSKVRILNLHATALTIGTAGAAVVNDPSATSTVAQHEIICLEKTASNTFTLKR